MDKTSCEIKKLLVLWPDPSFLCKKKKRVKQVTIDFLDKKEGGKGYFVKRDLPCLGHIFS